MKEVRKERTGWRDMEMSKRHRLYGFDVPAVDVDFLLLEYDHGKPAALIEHKHESAKLVDFAHPSMQALGGLYRLDKGSFKPVPFFVARYKHDFSKFKLMPVNHEARQRLSKTSIITEREYVDFLYGLRGRSTPAEVLRNLGIVQ